MRTRIMAGVTALAIAASSVVATAPAQARWHGGSYRHGWHGGGWGPALGGFAAGAIIGGVLAAQGPYYYGSSPYYDGPPGDAVGYCMSRFKSYDPGSGTYLGYDGYRHPCP